MLKKLFEKLSSKVDIEKGNFFTIVMDEPIKEIMSQKIQNHTYIIIRLLTAI
jgi:hypothetical protein